MGFGILTGINIRNSQNGVSKNVKLFLFLAILILLSGNLEKVFADEMLDNPPPGRIESTGNSPLVGLLIEDFEDGNYDGWTVTEGSFTASNRYLEATSGHSAAWISHPINLDTTEGMLQHDVAFPILDCRGGAYRLEVLDGGDSPEVEVLFFAPDVCTDWSGEPPEIRFKIDGYGYWELPWDADTNWHTYTLKFNKGVYELFYDGNKLITVNGPERLTASTLLIGGWQHQNPGTRYDNIRMYSGINTLVGDNIVIASNSETVTFSSVTSEGTTVIVSQTGNPRDAPPSGFRLRGYFVDVSTTATYSGTIEVCIDYSGIISGNEDNLRLMHWTGSRWEDVTTSLDTANNIICGQVTSLSWFGLAGYSPTVVGGIAVPVNKVNIVMPYIVSLLIGIAGTGIYVVMRRIS